MYIRLSKPLKSRSFFLFGARGTGKSTLLRALFPSQKDFRLWLDLLEPNVDWEVQKNPNYLMQILATDKKDKSSSPWIIIDEIQKAPHLLDSIHHLIETKKYKFALTGSSARKLKRGGANLLAGRALQNFLFPLTSLELGDNFKLNQALKYGTLPEVINISSEATVQAYLRTYVQTYLKEEIQVEQLVRKLHPFRSFLEIAAQSSGCILNYSKIAREIGSDTMSIKNYFQILEETLIGFYLPCYHRSVRKRQVKHPKFYLFDLGVKTALNQRLKLELTAKTSLYGLHFEHFIISEIFRYNHYLNLDWQLYYLMTKDNVEVDLIIERPGKATYLIEIKSGDSITEDSIRSISKITSAFDDPTKAFCLSQDSNEKEIRGVHCMHWREFFNKNFIKN